MRYSLNLVCEGLPTKSVTGVTTRSWLVLRLNTSESNIFAAQFVAELKFRVLEIDPNTAEIEGDEDGFAEEYPLEDVEISTNDFMGKVCFSTARISVDWLFRHGSLILISVAHGNLLTEMEKY